jgi:GDPmannose 4,6-dehydratase
MKRALIVGVSGQDGAYLARLLLEKGYEVHGTSRDAELQPFARLEALGIRDRVEVHSASLLDFRNLLHVIGTLQPDEIYNLAGQTSVSLSFSQPMETIESILNGTMRILEVMRYLRLPARLYNATTSECFGAIRFGTKCDERTPFYPRSPYATAKAAAHWAVINYREAYGAWACSGILFNHESRLRSSRFVTRKIADAVTRIKAGQDFKLELGDIGIWRDWGYAPDYVEAMWLMLQRDQPEEFVIATGEMHSLEEFVAAMFAEVDLDWHDHVVINRRLFRPAEVLSNCGNPSKAAEELGWRARRKFSDLPRLLLHGDA